MSKAITTSREQPKSYSASLLHSAAALWGDDFWGGAKPRPRTKKTSS